MPNFKFIEGQEPMEPASAGLHEPVQLSLTPGQKDIYALMLGQHNEDRIKEARIAERQEREDSRGE